MKCVSLVHSGDNLCSPHFLSSAISVLFFEFSVIAVTWIGKQYLTVLQPKYSHTSRKRTPSEPRVSVRLREVSTYQRVKKCTRGHIMYQNKYSKPLVIVLSITGLLDVAFLLHIHKLNTN